MKREVIIVGWIRKGQPADCGETMKNQLMVRRLTELGVRCRQMDFKDWKKHPWVIADLLWTMVTHKDNTLILSTSTINIYPLLKLLKSIGWRQNVVHWVIGGSLGDKVTNGVFRADVIGYANHTLVESGIMMDQLQKCGVKGVRQVPNFKPITYYPKLSLCGPTTRFVFLSRIMSEKGCDYIIDALKTLNTQGLKQSFTVDFYGKIDQGYDGRFMSEIETLDNVSYRGFLNLRENSGYDDLAKYDVMLFPTYWKGEGFAGIFIDSFISGVPIIASDWAHNTQFLKDNENAMIVPVHDVNALSEKMRYCMENKDDVNRLKRNCRSEASKYDINNIITKDLLTSIGV